MAVLLFLNYQHSSEVILFLPHFSLNSYSRIFLLPDLDLLSHQFISNYFLSSFGSFYSRLFSVPVVGLVPGSWFLGAGLN